MARRSGSMTPFAPGLLRRRGANLPNGEQKTPRPADRGWVTPPLRQRLGLAPDPRPLRHRASDRGLMARSLMFLFLAGASISLLALFVGHKPADEPPMGAP